jgi:hypothetical protein
LLLLTPLLLGAADEPGDLVPCGGTGVATSDAPIDILTARGTTAEDGLAMRFTITFSRPLPVPDDEGAPLRVDVLIHDPAVPDLSVDYYRGLNRIVRFDAVSVRAGLAIILLAERSESPFTSGVRVDGDTLTMTFPSRMVMPDPDLAGFDYSGLRWTVVARDEATCDILGTRARPTRRVAVVGAGSPAASPTPALPAATSHDPLVSGGLLLACLLSIAVGGAAGFAVARWRRRTE